MPLIYLVIVLIVIGVLLWLVNNFLAPYIAPPILKIINVVVVIAVVIWLLWILLGMFGGTGPVIPMRR